MKIFAKKRKNQTAKEKGENFNEKMMEFEDLPRMQSLTPEPEILKYDFNDKSSHISMDPEMNFNLGCKHISQVSTM